MKNKSAKSTDKSNKSGKNVGEMGEIYAALNNVLYSDCKTLTFGEGIKILKEDNKIFLIDNNKKAEIDRNYLEILIKELEHDLLNLKNDNGSIKTSTLSKIYTLLGKQPKASGGKHDLIRDDKTFEIKTLLGKPPGHSGYNSKFYMCYEIIGFTDEMYNKYLKDQNSKDINIKNSTRNPIKYATDLGCEVKYCGMYDKSFKKELEKIHADLPELLADILYRFRIKTTRKRDVLNFLKTDEEKQIFKQYDESINYHKPLIFVYKNTKTKKIEIKEFTNFSEYVDALNIIKMDDISTGKTTKIGVKIHKEKDKYYISDVPYFRFIPGKTRNAIMKLKDDN